LDTAREFVIETYVCGSRGSVAAYDARAVRPDGMIWRSREGVGHVWDRRSISPRYAGRRGSTRRAHQFRGRESTSSETTIRRGVRVGTMALIRR